MATDEDARKLFVAGLPDSITDESLRQLFVSTGSGIDELSMPRDRVTGRPRGFAFVTLKTAAEADKARQQLDGSFVEGKSISVRPFSSEPPARGERRSHPGGGPGGGGPRRGPGGGGPGGRPGGPPRDDPNKTLYVGNLPYDTDENELREIMDKLGAGEPARLHMPVDHASGRKRGFAFVNFATEEGAKKALDAMANLTVRGRGCAVHLAHARGERPSRPERSSWGPPEPQAMPPQMPDRGRPSRKSHPPPGRGGGEEFERGDRRGGRKGGGGGGQKDAGRRNRGGGNSQRYSDWESWDDD